MEADVFVSDESSQKHRYYDEALDLILRELHGVDKPFGGKMSLWEVTMDNACQ